MGIAPHIFNIPYHTSMLQLKLLQHITLTQNLQIKSGFNSWCCTFYLFGQIYNDMYPSLLYQTKYFHCLKITSAQSIHSLPPLSLVTTDLFSVYTFFLFQNDIQLESYSKQLFQTGFLHLVVCIWVLHGFSQLD